MSSYLQRRRSGSGLGHRLFLRIFKWIWITGKQAASTECRSVGSGGAGGLQPPNNLLKFVDFVRKKAVIDKVVGMKIQTRIYSTKIPASIKSAISFDVIEI